VRRILASVIMLAIACLLAPGIHAQEEQEPPPSEAEGEPLTVEQIQVLMELESIQLRFLVRDSDGRFMKNLSAQDFVVVENGREQNIALLKQQEVPINCVVMVDNSWSTTMFLAKAGQVAVDFFKVLQPESSAFVLFAENPRVIINWTEGAKDLTPFMGTVTKANGKTALYDSVIWVSKNMFKEKRGKNLIILLTDGIDTISRSSFPQMMRVTRDNGVTLYPIIYTNPYIENYRRSLGKGSRKPISSVSTDFHNMILMQNRFIDQSLRYGGRTIFSNAFRDLGNIYGDIIHEMKSQYVMLYQSSDLDTDKREVKVFTKKVPGKVFIEVSH